MLKIIENDIMRGTEKIGWISSNDIYNKEGKKLGYFSSNDIYDHDGHKLGYIEGNHLITSDEHKITLDDNRVHHVVGGSISDIERAAIRLLLGD